MEYSWDDWVPGDRLRKFSEENRQLAQSLKGQMDELRRASAPKSLKKKALDSDFSSTRGSEDRQMSVAATGRGQKRGRDYEIEKVCDFLSSVCPASATFFVRISQVVSLAPARGHLVPWSMGHKAIWAFLQLVFCAFP